MFNEGREIPHLESYSVRVAMYGLEQIHITVPAAPRRGSHYASGMGYGPKRKMTPTDNTSISAIGALVMSSYEDIILLVYHNKYARVRLSPAVLAPYGIRQFETGNEVPGRIAPWCAIAPPGAEAGGL